VVDFFPASHQKQPTSVLSRDAMDSPGIDLDMTLTSSPIQRVVGGDVNDDWEKKNDDDRNDKHGIFQPSIITTVSKSHSNDSINSDGTVIMLSKNHDKHVQGIDKGELPTSSNAIQEERTNNNDNMIVKDGNGTKTYCTKTMTMVELWKEEISMMNVTNTILLNDLVKLGADV
jgi:hypothetical protein